MSDDIFAPRKVYAMHSDKQMTKQEFADDTNVNRIVANYGRTGVFSSVTRRVPQYVDTTTVPDLQQAFNLVKQAQAEFAALPADVRAAARNDPRQFLAMVNDPRGREQLVKAGLEVEPREPAPAGGGVTPPAEEPTVE